MGEWSLAPGRLGQRRAECVAVALVDSECMVEAPADWWVTAQRGVALECPAHVEMAYAGPDRRARECQVAGIVCGRGCAGHIGVGRWACKRLGKAGRAWVVR